MGYKVSLLLKVEDGKAICSLKWSYFGCLPIRLFHHPTLYKRFHKQHHEWTAPIGVVATYAHPLEHLVNAHFLHVHFYVFLRFLQFSLQMSQTRWGYHKSPPSGFWPVLPPLPPSRPHFAQRLFQRPFQPDAHSGVMWGERIPMSGTYCVTSRQREKLEESQKGIKPPSMVCCSISSPTCCQW